MLASWKVEMVKKSIISAVNGKLLGKLYFVCYVIDNKPLVLVFSIGPNLVFLGIRSNYIHLE